MHNVRLHPGACTRTARWCVVNRVEIQQVVLNLVRNAIEALESVPPERRDILLRTAAAPDDTVEINVIDSGPGVDQNIVGRLFSPVRDDARLRAQGLGLAISRSIVEAHKGTLRYQAAECRWRLFRAPVTSRTRWRVTRRKTLRHCVIVVDDDEAVRSSTRLLLKSVGLPAVTYSSAQEFLDNYDPLQPGCVVLDVRMPG